MTGPSVTDEPHPDPLAALDAFRRAAAAGDGVAMVVALHDGRPGRVLDVTDAQSRADGAVLARLFDHYEEALRRGGFPNPEPEAELTGARTVIDTLAVLSDQHVRQPVDEHDAAVAP